MTLTQFNKILAKALIVFYILLLVIGIGLLIQENRISEDLSKISVLGADGNCHKIKLN